MHESRKVLGCRQSNTYLDFAKRGFVLATPCQRLCAASLLQRIFDATDVGEQVDIDETLLLNVSHQYDSVI